MYSAVEDPSLLLRKHEGAMPEKSSSRIGYARWIAAGLLGAAMVSTVLTGSFRSATSLNSSNLNADKNDGITMEKASGQIIHAFGKWTLTSASLENALDATEAMWLAFNQYILTRNQSNWPNYQLIGSTSCEVTQRKWTALRYDAGDNNIHWVHDDSSTNPVDGDISVAEMSAYMKNLHGDLTGSPDQFMDQRYTMAAYEIDPYVHMAMDLKEMHGWPVKFYKTNTDTDDHFAWVVQTANNDGQIFETLSLNGPSENFFDLFEYDECGFIPTTGLNQTRESCTSRIEYLDESDATSTTRTDGCFFFEYGDEKFSGDELGEYIEIGKQVRNMDLPLTLPWVTHVASTDPSTDAAFFLKYYGTHDGIHDITEHEVSALAQAGTSHAQCSYDSSWIKIQIDDGDSPTSYLHLSYHRNARTGQLKDIPNFGVKEYQEYMSQIRKNMEDNVYDAFMDNHIGLDIGTSSKDTSQYFVNISNSMYADGVPLLTRREPIPGSGGVSAYWNDGYEKFSTFFYLPVSYQVIQMSVIDVTQTYLRDQSLPEYCDWNFCPNFYNWRAYPDSRTREGKLIESTDCGFSSI